MPKSTIHPEFLMSGPYGTIPTVYASRGGSKVYNKAALRGFGKTYNKAALRGFGKTYNKAALRGFGKTYNKAALRGFGSYSAAVNPSFGLIGGDLDENGKHIEGTKEETEAEIAAWKAAKEAKEAAAAAAASQQIAEKSGETEEKKQASLIPTAQEVKEADKSLEALVVFGEEVGANPRYILEHPGETLMFAQEYGPKVWRFLKGCYKKIYKLVHKVSGGKPMRKNSVFGKINDELRAKAAWAAQQQSVLQPLPQKTDVDEVMEAMTDEPENVVSSVGAKPVEGSGWYFY